MQGYNQDYMLWLALKRESVLNIANITPQPSFTSLMYYSQKQSLSTQLLRLCVSQESCSTWLMPYAVSRAV